jgi:hypothetical protein
MVDKINFLEQIDHSNYIHAANYLQKFKQYDTLKKRQQEALDDLLIKYSKFYKGNLEIIGYGKNEIKKRTKLLNDYFNYYKDNYDNFFTAQGKFRSTIIEEFMYVLFKDLISDIKIKIKDETDSLKMGGTKAYTNLYFSAKNLKNFIVNPQIGVNQKNQDFAIYRPITLNIKDAGTIQANLPVVAIENKTYIDKTMLEGSVATADKIKAGNPYSLFIIVTETYDVDLSVDPAYSRIDQIYVLRKGKDRNVPIFYDVLNDLVENVNNHLVRNWSDIENKMKKYGKII